MNNEETNKLIFIPRKCASTIFLSYHLFCFVRHLDVKAAISSRSRPGKTMKDNNIAGCLSQP